MTALSSNVTGPAALWPCLFACVVFWPAAGRAIGQQVPDTRDLVAAASAYVARYAADLKFVLADEDYLQRTFDAAGTLTAERRIRGELYLAFLPADGVWIAVHDVAEIDGVPLSGREDLRALLRQGDVTPAARRVADRNAAFNIGSIARNFNEPTLPLLLFDAKRLKSVSFRRERVAQAGGRTRVVLAFTERDRPTLVRSRAGRPIFSKGTITLDVETGRVEETTIELSEGGIRARLQTSYAPDEKLGLWVPAVFTERYEGSPHGRREVIECEAKYSNYRRFEVVGRIKPPGPGPRPRPQALWAPGLRP